jgi:putative spermidine/putrescine transport system substrate-binding protein
MTHLVTAAAVLSLGAAACGSSSPSKTTGTTAAGTATTAKVDASKAASLADFGGMAGLVAAAKAEGTLNTITLPANWANYGNIIKDFQTKYGIKVNDDNPDGSSQDEINAVQQLKGQSRAPDVLDMGTPFAVTADKSGLLAPYKVASWDQIPDASKAPDATWFDDYGGYVAIGYDTAKVTTAPTSFADLNKPIYKNMIALNGDPTQAGAAFAGVFAAALANGGSLDNIQPGIDYFAALKKSGNFVPVKGGPSTVQSGQTPILVWWDYLQASEVASQVSTWKVIIPSDGHYADYYSQAISATAPHPAAARLWEEYLYSTEGQNLWLQGQARPIELTSLVQNGSVDQAALSKLPPAPSGGLQLATQDQLTAAKAVVAQKWAAALGG